MNTPYPELLIDRDEQHREIIAHTRAIRQSIAAYRDDQRAAAGLCITCDNEIRDDHHRQCSTCRARKRAAA